MHVGDRGEQPELFRKLKELGCLEDAVLYAAEDGFRAAMRSLAEILARRGITELPGDGGRPLECRLFFDDWYLCAVPDGSGHVCGLFKMREQEYDKKMGLFADGDTPGVTVSFVALDTEPLLQCLTADDESSRSRLNREINRVVAERGQQHSRALKAYFLRTEARGAYLIAWLYTGYIASLARSGAVTVPERYAETLREQGLRGRIPQFIEENNRAAGYPVCDHEKIYIRDAACPSEHERLAILATHTGNTSVYSFAAEVQYHARFLQPWAKLPLPPAGRSAYASAIRADMSIADAELVGPTPYYRHGSRLVKAQIACHQNRAGSWENGKEEAGETP